MTTIGMNFYGQDEWSDGVNPFPSVCFKTKNKFKLIIPGVSASGVGSLPPLKCGRPSLEFKEMSAEHLNETIYFPAKPNWKPIQLTLYDIVKSNEFGQKYENPVFTWIKQAYDPQLCSYWKPCLEPDSIRFKNFKCAEMQLIHYDGCGNEIERWTFEHVWPQSAEFSEGTMDKADLVYCDVTLRYDRAYIDNNLYLAADLNDMPSVTSQVSCTSTSIGFAPIFMPVIAPEFLVMR